MANNLNDLECRVYGKKWGEMKVYNSRLAYERSEKIGLDCLQAPQSKTVLKRRPCQEPEAKRERN